MAVSSRALSLCMRASISTIAGLLILGAAQTNAHAASGARLHWLPGPVHLDRSQATIRQPAFTRMLRGKDAATFSAIVNGTSAGEDDVEAIAADRKTGDLVYFEYTDAGYVKADDFSGINADEMIANITKNTDDANAERERRGIPAMHVVGWLEKPAYDKATDSVRWSIAAKTGGQKLFNAVALKLGRHGYQQLTWVGDTKEYRSRGGLLDAVIRADRFDSGARYDDYKAGDKVAEFGVAALVGTVAGAGLAKTGFFAGLLLLFKKLFIVIAAMIAGAYRWLTNKFKRDFSK